MRLQRRVFQKRSFQVLNRVYCKNRKRKGGDLQEAIVSLKKGQNFLKMKKACYELPILASNFISRKIDESLYTDSTDLDSYAATIAAAKKGFMILIQELKIFFPFLSHRLS